MTPEYHHVDIPNSPVETKSLLPLLPKNEAAPPSPTLTGPTPRKSWMIISLPLAIALVFTAGMCCLSTAEIKSALQSLEHLTMASASWPIMPITFEEQMGRQQQLHLQQPSPFSVQQMSKSIAQKEGTHGMLFVDDGCGDEDEDENEGVYDDDDDDDEEEDEGGDDEEEDEGEDDEEEESIEQSFQALEIITIEEDNLVEVLVIEEEPLSIQDLVQLTTAAPVSNPVTLFRRRDQDDDQEDDETEDEDRQDHFPSSMNDEDETSAQDEEEQTEEEEKEDKTSTPTNPIGDNKDKEPHHNQHQDQNTNLGGTGGNGPILLCSSRVCLPSLRDSILAKLSVQIRHVMDHLRNGQVLVQRMDTTAPFTKNLLVSSQSDIVQQLEENIIKDLKDWVMGHKHSSTSSGNAIKPHMKSPLFSTADAPSIGDKKPNNTDEGEDGELDRATDISVEAEAAFLGAEDEEGLDQVVTTSGVSSPGDENEPEFRMVGLDLEDDDDDDEDHEYDIVKTPSKSKKKISSSSRLQRRASGAHHEYFLSADKLLMQQEWSRWIAHWVHHAKLLVLSHTLATRTLNSMNQLAITDDNVPLADQRHWSWNLDKALATVMVASEMLCGGPTDPKDAEQFLQALSMPVVSSSSSFSSPSSSLSDATPKIMALTVNAQKCIEAWRADLEEILKTTATTAA